MSYLLAAAPAGLGSTIPSGTISDPIAQTILRLQPTFTASRARDLASKFRAASRRSGLPWQILVSIAHHESSLGVHTINARTKDYGLMQINKKTSMLYGLSQDRILRDDAYSLDAACKILNENRSQYGRKIPYWLGIYRSGTRLTETRIRENAKQYDRMIRLTAARIGYRN